MADYSATINWGDGHSDLGTITLSNGVFTVSDRHTYAEEGTFNGTITLTHDTATNTVVTLTATVADQAVTPSTTSLNINATEGQTFTSSSLLTFTDPAGAEALADYSATINWGDGHSDLGTITLSNGVFTVSDSHTYAEEGTFNGTITLAHDTATNTVVTLNATIADAALHSTGTTLTATQGFPLTNVTLATFSDDNPNATISDFTANTTIAWGDGTTSTGSNVTIVTDGAGFAVEGTHTYSTTGTEAVVVTINDIGGSTTTANSTITVSAATLNVQGINITSTEGQQFTGVVATIIDTSANPNPTAIITWDDGTQSTGTVTPIANQPGQFTVSGTHPYFEEGSNLSITVNATDGTLTGTGSSTATVADAAISGSPTTVNPVNAGTSTGLISLGLLTDSNLGGLTTDFTGTINWGPGEGTSAATFTSSGGTGQFFIEGSHTFATAGDKTVNVTVNDDGGSTTTFSVFVPVTAVITGTEGAAIPASQIVTFTDPATPQSATINWGDGSSADTTTSFNNLGNNLWSVNAPSHTFLEEGTYLGSITITDNQTPTSNQFTSSLTASIADAPIIVTPATITIPIFTGQQFGNLQLATFTDTDPNGKAGDYSATVDWGDGNISTNVLINVSGPNGTVLGSHVYTNNSTTDTITITVTDVGGATASAQTTINVTTPITIMPGNNVGVENQPFANTNVVATFTDPGNLPVGDYSSIIMWGDNTADSSGSIVILSTLNGVNTYGVEAGHNYVEDGSFGIQVDVTKTNETVVNKSITATIQESPVNVTSAGASLTGQNGQIVGSGTILANFIDNANEGPGAYTATINWGDNSTSQGLINQLDPLTGSYMVEGQGHTYSTAGSYTISVTVSDDHVMQPAVTDTATITESQIIATPATITGVENQQLANVIVATFTDVGNQSPSTFIANINWGDPASLSSGTVVQLSPDNYEVLGTHAYTESGNYTVLVTINQGTQSVAPTSTAVITDPPLTNFSPVTLPPLQEGQTFPAGVIVAIFADTGSDGSYAATINWGDGTSSAGTIQPEGDLNVFNVLGGPHTYTESGNFAVTTTINATGPGDTDTVMITNTAVITDAPLTGSPAILQPDFAGVPISFSSTGLLTIGTFFDNNAFAPISDYTASVNWGDGSQSTQATIATGQAGTYDINANHTFTTAGSYNAVITVNDVGGASTTIPVTFTVDTPLTDPENSTNTITLGTFHTLDPNPTGDINVSINWGDGSQPTTGTINQLSQFLYDVTGSHSYEDGFYQGTVTLQDNGTFIVNPTTINFVVSVPESPITATNGGNFSAIEGAPTPALTVATFTDPANEALGSYTATIDWGDQTTSQGQISLSNGTYSVEGSHTYLEEGSHTITTTILDDTAQATATAQISVGDAALHSTGETLSATQGAPLTNVILATFSDDNPHPPIGDFSATINWGDGTPLDTNFTIVTDGTDFAVEGTHTYSTSGSDAVTITINDIGGSTTTAHSTINVSTAPTINASGTSVSSTEGLLFNGTVATFTDTNPNVTLNNLNATIDWGDGSQTSTGNITLNNGTYSVQGSHTYAEEGNNTLTIHITDSNDNTTATAISSDTTTDQAVTASTNSLNINATEGTAFTSSSLLTFTDPAGAEALTDYSATINWGDGHSDLGTITLSNGVFTVSDSHTYAEEGTFNGTITLAHDTATNTVVTLNATVADQAVAPNTTLLNINATEGTAFTSSSLLTFTDPAGAEALTDYSATINWGDGHSDLGTITLSNGVFTVSDSHTYAEEGTFNGTITLAHDTATNTVVTLNATVADQAVTASTTLLNINATEGTAFTSSSLLTFTDPAGAEALTDYSATINWGDGHSDLGTITLSNGVFTVSDSHTYAEEGTFNGTITLAHDTATNTVVTLNATVADQAVAPNTNSLNINATEGTAFTSSSLLTFTDPAGAEALSDYSATINWGDGHSDLGTITLSNGVFTVSDSHTYAEEGTFNGTITLAHDTATNTVVTLNATVADVNPIVTAQPFTGNEGVNNNLFVATFTDPGSAPGTGVYTVGIDWGDNTQPSVGTATFNNLTNVYDVTGSHAYLNPGPYTTTITVLDFGGGQGSTTSQATIADVSPVVAGIPINLSEPPVILVTTGIATFTDPGNTTTNIDPTSNFSATIDWGDGTAQQPDTSTGTITYSADNNTYTVSAGHTYTHQGNFNVQITVMDHEGAIGFGTSTITVTDVSPVVQVSPIAAAEGVNFTPPIGVGFFTDAGSNNPPGSYTATIDWGDGTAPSLGTVMSDPAIQGRYDVLGTHAYTEEGNFTIQVTVLDQGGASGSGTNSVMISDAPLTSTGSTPISATQGVSLSATLATFQDPVPEATSSYFWNHRLGRWQWFDNLYFSKCKI